jgi:tetratricopeptide (TPR) repeat protein
MVLNKNLQKFLEEVSTLADVYSGKDFTKEIISLRVERERILNNIWREDTFREYLDQHQKEKIFRDIDFDTIIHYAVKYLEPKQYIEFLFEVSKVAIKHGEFQKAEHLLLLIVTKYRLYANESLLAKAFQQLGNLNFYRNKFQNAEEHFNKSLEIFDSLKDHKGIATIKNDLGALMVVQGRMADGESLFTEARNMAKKEGYSEYIAKTSMNLGNLFHMRGYPDDAIKYYDDALNAVDKKDEKETLANIYLNTAIAYKYKADYAKAKKSLEKAVELCEQTGNKYQKGLAYLTEAEVMCLENKLSSSTTLTINAFSIFSELGDRLSMAEAYKILGMINRRSKNFDISYSYLDNSRRINEEYNHSLNLGEIYVEMALLYQDRGDSSKAAEHLNKAIVSYEAINAQPRIEAVKKILLEL